MRARHRMPSRWARLPGTGRLLVGGNTTAGACHLTFDDGPHPDGTPAVLDALDALGATATFFMLVERAESLPTLVREVVVRGHDVGLHGIDHRRLDRRPTATVRRALDEGRDRLADLADAPVEFWRPPFGRIGLPGLVAAGREGLTTVLWSHDPRDWDPDGADGLAGRIARCLVPGAVVVLHDGADTLEDQGVRTARALTAAAADHADPPPMVTLP